MATAIDGNMKRQGERTDLSEVACHNRPVHNSVRDLLIKCFAATAAAQSSIR
jgi:hypothetical protein